MNGEGPPGPFGALHRLGADRGARSHEKGNAVTSLLGKLESKKPVSAKAVSDAVALVEKLVKAPGTSKSRAEALQSLVQELETLPKGALAKSKVKPKAEPKKKPKPEAEPKAEAEPDDSPKSKAPAKPAKVRGLGKGLAKLEVDLPDTLKTGFDNLVAATRTEKAPRKADDPSQVAHLLKASKNSKSKEVAAWSQNWIVGDNTVEGSQREAAEKFMTDLRESGSWAQVQYAATQAIIRQRMPELKKEGVIDADGFVTLYRGVNGNAAKQAKSEGGSSGEVKIKVRGVSSWSDSKDSAFEFTDESQVLLEQKVHFSRVASMWQGENFLYHANKEREWIVIGPEDGLVETKLASHPKFKKTKKAARSKVSMIELDDDNEDWLRKVRLDRLKKRGWKGTVKEWLETAKKLGRDPLDAKPPVTSPKKA